VIQICTLKSNFRERPFTLRLRRSRGVACPELCRRTQSERENYTLQLPTVRAERSESEVEARTRKLLNELQLGITIIRTAVARGRYLTTDHADTGMVIADLTILDV
jgi:hypothetical protein